MKLLRLLLAVSAMSLALPPTAMSAGLTEYALVTAEYGIGVRHVVPPLNKNYGNYLESFVGKVTGRLSGSVVWDLYDDKIDHGVHRVQFAGRVTAPDQSTIDFEATGFFIERQADRKFWDAASAIRFHAAKGPAYRDLEGKIGLWEGTAHATEDNVVHDYKIYVPKK